ncbi:hypothetical protein C8A05DRAFT_33283 [Staphylotrichum tortipilum]|uniref:NmrA-like domain-containing protein n=1 Tax=Staphylotrichum tortipilum TaxID=2831512 RepID=A0AAN6MLA5_9PEZI|nr:hypothetical protein C8A05DRAFT_33283 [Staphylotrichum longicolle]
MVRIVIAGTGAFALILAQQINQTANPLLVLSCRENPEFQEACGGCDLTVIDYRNRQALQYALRGSDIIISTISGPEQINLIDAARSVRGMRVFVPSEFEGALANRPDPDPVDRGYVQSALGVVRDFATRSPPQIRYTVFSCGLFMERFAPGGLQSYGIGAGSRVQTPDDYLVNVGEARAVILPTTPGGAQARLSLTSVYDVAQFITAAIELGTRDWPTEFRMRGETMTVQQLVDACSEVRGVPFNITVYDHETAEAEAQYCQETQDWDRWHFLQKMLQTANERYHVRQPNLNNATQVQPTTFRTWLQNMWGLGAANPFWQG